jgi:dTDP-4-dehydrorhamnose 3,5-epimerase
MIFKPTPLSGSYEIEMTPFQDERGWFGRFYCKEEFASIGHDKEWVQMNHSFTVAKGAVRGMHFQYPPFTEIKMVRCIAGKVYDVMVDLRKDSPAFLKWTAIELSAEKRNMVYIPAGFAHGFQTLEENCELIYLHSEFYNREAESGVKYNDTAIGIKWPLEATQVSERDQAHKLIDSNFKGITGS